MLQLNPEMSNYLSKKEALDEKKLHITKRARQDQDIVYTEEMEKTDRRFLRRQRKAVLETWAAPCRDASVPTNSRSQVT